MPIPEILFHMMLEGFGAVGVKCALGFCQHTHHRIMVWAVLAFITSALTVHLVG